MHKNLTTPTYLIVYNKEIHLKLDTATRERNFYVLNKTIESPIYLPKSNPIVERLKAVVKRLHTFIRNFISENN